MQEINEGKEDGTLEQHVSVQLVSVEEMARILDVPVSWIYRQTRRGQKSIPHIRVGKYVRFNTEEVVVFLKIQTNGEMKNA